MRLDVYYTDGTHDTAFGGVPHIEDYLDRIASDGRAARISHYTLVDLTA